MIQSFSGTRKASQSCGKLLWIGCSIDGCAVSWIWVKQPGQEDLQVNEGNKWEIPKMHLLTIQMHEAKLRIGVPVLEFLTFHITWLEGNAYCTYTHWSYQSIELGSEISLLECLLVIVFPPNSFCVFSLLCSVFFCIVFSPSLLVCCSQVA